MQNHFPRQHPTRTQPSDSQPTTTSATPLLSMCFESACHHPFNNTRQNNIRTQFRVVEAAANNTAGCNFRDLVKAKRGPTGSRSPFWTRREADVPLFVSRMKASSPRYPAFVMQLSLCFVPVRFTLPPPVPLLFHAFFVADPTAT